MKFMPTLIIFLLFCGLAAAAPIGNPNVARMHEPVLVDRIDLFSGSTGNLSVDSGTINGNLLAIRYVNGNFSTEGLVYLNLTWPYAEAIESYDLSDGNYTSLHNESLPIAGPINAHLYMGQANKSASVFVFYR